MSAGKLQLSDIKIIPLDTKADLSYFSCSEQKLNEFLIENALEDHNNLYSVTRLVYYKDILVGFFTLIADNISVKEIEAKDYENYKYKKLPAVKIARLATDKDYERKGIGRLMITEIFSIIYDITYNIGCRILTVDAKSEALGFYQKFAFRVVNSKHNSEYIPMYIDLKKLIDLNQESISDVKLKITI